MPTVAKIRTEHQEQVRLVSILRNFYPQMLFFAIPNGGSRHPAEAARMKAEGVTAGVCDLFFVASNASYNGLFIEMKRSDGGRVSPEQKRFMDGCLSRGYKAVVCSGAKEALEVIKAYYGIVDNIVFES